MPSEKLHKLRGADLAAMRVDEHQDHAFDVHEKARLCGLAASYHHHVVTEFEGIGREADDGHAWG